MTAAGGLPTGSRVSLVWLLGASNQESRKSSQDSSQQEPISMARKQSRRSVSLNASVYRLLMQEAERCGVSAGAVIADGLKALGLIVPATTHQTADEVRRMRKARGYRAVKPPLAVQRFPSLERRMLGDAAANALGFR